MGYIRLIALYIPIKRKNIFASAITEVMLIRYTYRNDSCGVITKPVTLR